MNCTRRKDSPSASEKQRAIIVLPRPGTSSSSTCPRPSTPSSTSSRARRRPTTTFSISSSTPAASRAVSDGVRAVPVIGALTESPVGRRCGSGCARSTPGRLALPGHLAAGVEPVPEVVADQRPGRPPGRRPGRPVVVGQPRGQQPDQQRPGHQVVVPRRHRRPGQRLGDLTVGAERRVLDRRPGRPLVPGRRCAGHPEQGDRRGRPRPRSDSATSSPATAERRRWPRRPRSAARDHAPPGAALARRRRPRRRSSSRVSHGGPPARRGPGPGSSSGAASGVLAHRVLAEPRLAEQLGQRRGPARRRPARPRPHGRAARWRCRTGGPRGRAGPGRRTADRPSRRTPRGPRPAGRRAGAGPLGGVDGGHQQLDLVRSCALVERPRSAAPDCRRSAAQRVASALPASTRPTRTSTVQLVRCPGRPTSAPRRCGGPARGGSGSEPAAGSASDDDVEGAASAARTSEREQHPQVPRDRLALGLGVGRRRPAASAARRRSRFSIRRAMVISTSSRTVAEQHPGPANLERLGQRSQSSPCRARRATAATHEQRHDRDRTQQRVGSPTARARIVTAAIQPAPRSRACPAQPAEHAAVHATGRRSVTAAGLVHAARAGRRSGPGPNGGDGGAPRGRSGRIG